MLAIIETGGKQYRVSEGEILNVEKLDATKGAEVVFDKVLMLDDKVGAPYVEGAKVVAKVEKQGRAKKIIVFKFRNKKNYRKKQGHRQSYTKLTVEAINA